MIWIVKILPNGSTKTLIGINSPTEEKVEDYMLTNHLYIVGTFANTIIVKDNE